MANKPRWQTLYEGARACDKFLINSTKMVTVSMLVAVILNTSPALKIALCCACVFNVICYYAAVLLRIKAVERYQRDENEDG